MLPLTPGAHDDCAKRAPYPLRFQRQLAPLGLGNADHDALGFEVLRILRGPPHFDLFNFGLSWRESTTTGMDNSRAMTLMVRLIDVRDFAFPRVPTLTLALAQNGRSQGEANADDLTQVTEQVGFFRSPASLSVRMVKAQGKSL
jgi:hypothetical protein